MNKSRMKGIIHINESGNAQVVDSTLFGFSVSVSPNVKPPILSHSH